MVQMLRQLVSLPMANRSSLFRRQRPQFCRNCHRPLAFQQVLLPKTNGGAGINTPGRRHRRLNRLPRRRTSGRESNTVNRVLPLSRHRLRLPPRDTGGNSSLSTPSSSTPLRNQTRRLRPTPRLCRSEILPRRNQLKPRARLALLLLLS